MKAERQENHTKIVSGDLLGGPGAPRGPPLFPLDAFSIIFGRPGGVRRPSGEPLGVALGALGASFGAPGAVFWRVESARGDSRAESLKKRGFGIDFGLIFGILFFVVFLTLFGASPALFLHLLGVVF